MVVGNIRDSPEGDRMEDARVFTLGLLYGLPGYAEAPLTVKNFIYDLVIHRVLELTPVNYSRAGVKAERTKK